MSQKGLFDAQGAAESVAAPLGLDVSKLKRRALVKLMETSCIYGDVDTVRALTEAGCSPCMALDSMQRQPIHQAAAHGQVGVCELLLDLGVPVNVRDASEETPLHHGAYRNHLEVCRLLLQRGADVNALRCGENSVLHMGITKNANVQLVALLIAAGATVDARNAQGYTVLHEAVRSGAVHLLTMLAEAGASVKAFTKYGHTAMHLTRGMYGRFSIPLLQQLGLSVDEPDVRGDSPLFAAVDFHCLPAIVDLVEAGANREALDHQGCSVLQRGLCADFKVEEHIVFAMELLALGFDARRALDHPDGVSPKVVAALERPLHACIECGLVTQCVALIERGYDPRHRDGRRKSALQLAEDIGWSGLDALRAALARRAAAEAAAHLGETLQPW